MRNDAEDANLPRRIDGRGYAALPAASASATSAASADADLRGWLGNSGGFALPGSSATSASAAGS